MPVRIFIEICGSVDCTTPTLQQEPEQKRRQRRPTESGAAAANGGNEHSNTTILVTVPSLVDGPQSNVLANILITQVDAIMAESSSVSDNSHSAATTAFVTSLTLEQLVMTPEGTHGILLFLAIHAHSVTQVSFRDLIQLPLVVDGDEYAANNDNVASDFALQMIDAVAQALVGARLERLELSHMTLSPQVWQCWKTQKQLTMLKLDYCIVNDASLQALFEQMSDCFKSLQDLYFVLSETQLSSLGLDAADRILTACQQLSSLRWVYKYFSTPPLEFGAPTNKFPMAGLRQLVTRDNAEAATLLQQLVLEGCLLNDHDIGQLCSILSELTSLRNLKLRNLQLTNAHTQTIARALFHAQAPLKNMDWSGNKISQPGLQSVLDLVASLSTPIRSLFLNSNHINRECFNMLIDFLQVNHLADSIDLRLLNNPYDAERIAPLLALALWEAERERDDALRALKDVKENRSSRSLKLEQENAQLKEQLETMFKAFAIIGAAQGVEEHVRLLDRVTRLEDSVLSRGQVSRQSSGRSSRQGSNRDLGSRQGSSRDLGGRQGSSRDLGGSWQGISHDHVLQTPPGSRRPMALAPNLMETPREDRRPALPAKTKSPDTFISGMSSTTARSRRPPSAAKSADGGVLHRMQQHSRSGSSRRLVDTNVNDEFNVDRTSRSNAVTATATSSRQPPPSQQQQRPIVARSLSANISRPALEDGSPQADVLTNISGHGSSGGGGGARRIPISLDQAPSSGQRRLATASSTSAAIAGARMHQSYSGSSTQSASWAADSERVNQSYNGFSGNWDLDDVKETPYEE
ncbi:hypothetical protein MPSEU_000589400 [Mayamaea pseudoterrestris]|nr:hypothetical protein MPSEU_000589400 [Mayamaea pseudoterrestris]